MFIEMLPLMVEITRCSYISQIRMIDRWSVQWLASRHKLANCTQTVRTFWQYIMQL